MGKRQRWTHELVGAEALKYNSRGEFAASSASAYNYSRENGIIDAVCSHMPAVRKTHTDKSLRARASQFMTRSEFMNKASPEYQAAKKRGRIFVDSICSHMTTKLKTHTEESLRNAASRFNSRKEFERGSKPEAWAARARGLKFYNSICAHMEFRSWTKQEVLIEARKYDSINEFRRFSPGAANRAWMDGYLDEAYATLERGKGGFDENKPASLYFFEFSGPNGATAWKVGITNLSAKARAAGYGLEKGWARSLLAEYRFDKGSDAYMAEQQILAKFSEFSWDESYDGASPIKNGFTELMSINPHDEWIRSANSKSYIAETRT